jgi:hypothetical protein
MDFAPGSLCDCWWSGDSGAQVTPWQQGQERNRGRFSENQVKQGKVTASGKINNLERQSQVWWLTLVIPATQ